MHNEKLKPKGRHFMAGTEIVINPCTAEPG